MRSMFGLKRQEISGIHDCSVLMYCRRFGSSYIPIFKAKSIIINYCKSWNDWSVSWS